MLRGPIGNGSESLVLTQTVNQTVNVVRGLILCPARPNTVVVLPLTDPDPTESSFAALPPLPSTSLHEQ
jgi:hypothetical protein